MPERISAPFARYIGTIAEEVGEGGVRLSIQTGPEHADRWGRVHTGVLTSVMDSVIGIGLGRARGEGAREAEGPHATIEMSTSFYGIATPGDEIVAEGRVLRIDGPVAFGEVEAHRRSDGELLAKARLTFVIPGARR
jgi:acyl-coenzyme A thioesterase PaaI-like protein